MKDHIVEIFIAAVLLRTFSAPLLLP